jgi:hypothetical protein
MASPRCLGTAVAEYAGRRAKSPGANICQLQNHGFRYTRTFTIIRITRVGAELGNARKKTES